MIMEAHNGAVASISERLRQFYAQRRPFRVYHGSTNSTRVADKSRDNTVDTSKLNHILEVDEDNKIALVEPNVSMDALVNATVKHGLVPLVVMEFPGITVGGGFSGSAGESSSCRHGPFDSTINWIEIVLPNGDISRASKTEKPDLFWGAASAFGTLGIVTLLEVQLRDAADFVELTHYPVGGVPEASKKIQEEVANPAVEFVDAIAFSPKTAVVCSGRLVDAIPKGAKPRRYLRRHDSWFYLDVQKRAEKSKQPVVDYVPLIDYLFRWDRGGFWVAKYAYKYFFTPFNRITRSILDTYMHARVMYHALHKSGLSDTYIIQDVGVPYSAVDEFYRWVDQTLGIYPIWLCPIRTRRDAPDSAHGLHADFADPKGPEFMLNFGIWGPGPSDYEELVRLNRAIEQKLHELGGNKTLYAQAYYTEEEFWQSYNRPAYEGVREKYHAAHLPSVYDKVKVDEYAKKKTIENSRMPTALRHVRPFQGLYGVYKAWRGGDYLLQKKGETTNADGSPKQDSQGLK
ncbi:FAD-binding domain-containing protein [Annulohypoxylon truncatum]|uniref:FAD-binding domain-containing protein n=1 Tax=Annulohypoxylon truncatum TaxID=327061 RepID=UPI00200757E4|nr:FAD-binding domain-containing protein [Annulohypoxylon truncatum]KAI1213150.1 FAD-binding domain-containing protein [Annulohypoxylon truncatum]